MITPVVALIVVVAFLMAMIAVGYLFFYSQARTEAERSGRIIQLLLLVAIGGLQLFAVLH